MMTYLPEFLTLFAINFLNILSPGPETALMIYNSGRHSRKIGLYTGFGIVASTIIHKSYTLLGFGMVVARSPILFTTIKYAGSGYLLYLGYRAFFPGKKIMKKAEKPRTLTPRKAFRMGFLMDILHPSASLFFMSIVAATVSPKTPLSVQVVYGTLLVLTSLCWYSALALVFSNSRLQATIQSMGNWVDRITGLALIGLGIRLAFLSTTIHP